MLTFKIIIGVFIALNLMTMTVSSQPIEAASSGAGVLSLLKNMGQIAIESFLEWAKKGFPLKFPDLGSDATANFTNAKVLEICGNGESEASNFEAFGVNCSSK